MGSNENLASIGEAVMSLDIEHLQGKVFDWSTRNFGDQPSYRSLLGIFEEAGELSHAHLKGEQGIRHSPDDILRLKKDAIGDIVIYLMDYCSREGLSLNECIATTWHEVSGRSWNPRKE